MKTIESEIAVIGAGIAGLAVAYYLAISGAGKKVTLIDQGAAMGFTSAHSGENYRNWWPHPVMRALTDLSIDLLEHIAGATSNRINMSRRGYVLATRSADIGEFLAASQENIRVHTGVKAQAYGPSLDWESAPDGVDVLANSALINSHFPYFDENVRSVIHIRRGGDISGQQLGQFMLEQIREHGGQLVQTRVLNISRDSNFIIEANGQIIRADVLVNAAGPFAGTIAEMLGVTLPITNVLQQKIAFIDEKQAIARTMPFSVDLDGQKLDWEEDERALLLENPDTAWLTRLMPGAIHCRPDGGVNGKWIRLGWAYNQKLDTPVLEPLLDDSFPEIVLRGAARLNPALKAYYGHLPRKRVHYGGYYTKTDENWPLIGPAGVEGAFMVAALSGFGTMAACGAGKLCADWINGNALPDYADALGLGRYDDQALMTELASANEGIL